jgi:hypothetical protein
MTRPTTRTPEEINRLLSGYANGGLTRRQYCEQQGIAVTTLDYYRQRQQKGPQTSRKASPLVRVKVQTSAPSAESHERQAFSLVLGQGRRIESHWNFNEQELLRLIRIVESA